MKILNVLAVCKSYSEAVCSNWYCIFFDKHRSYSFGNDTRWADAYKIDSAYFESSAIWKRVT